MNMYQLLGVFGVIGRGEILHMPFEERSKEGTSSVLYLVKADH